MSEKTVGQPKALLSILEDEPANLVDDVEDAYKRPHQRTLTERQRLIMRLKLRGISDSATARIIGISLHTLKKDLVRMQRYHANAGTRFDQNTVVSEALCLYDEVSFRAWEIFSDSESKNAEKLKALEIVSSSQDKKNKLCLQVGIIKQAPAERVVDVHISNAPPLVRNWSVQGRQNLSRNIIEAQLEPLDDPTPPEEDDDWEEGDCDLDESTDYNEEEHNEDE